MKANVKRRLKVVAAWLGLDVGRHWRRVLVDHPPDVARSVFLAGKGRGGTTWVSNVLNSRNEYRYVFEPFECSRVPMCRHFKYPQYLRPGDCREKYLGPVRAALTGRVRNAWTESFNKKWFCSRRLVKSIRANLMLKWLRTNFPQMPIILLLRHPCAVASSWMRMGWGDPLANILSQQTLMQDFLEPFRAELESARTDFEKHVLAWCVEHYVPLRQLQPGDVYLTFYENLCRFPEQEIERLFGFLGKPLDAGVYQKLSRPSPVTRKDSPIYTGASLLDGWRAYVTPAQVRRAEQILEMFELDKIYSGDSLPQVEAACAMLERNGKPQRTTQAPGRSLAGTLQ